jgi:hypothetical protein
VAAVILAMKDGTLEQDKLTKRPSARRMMRLPLEGEDIENVI